LVRPALTPLVIAGPTAAGKSELALRLAARDDGMIICADSRQVFEGMVIGSGGPSDADRARAPHAGYNDVPPEQTWDAGRFLEVADAHVAAAQQRGKRPILVGGSGMYLRSWRFGLGDVPPRDDAVRARLESEVAAQGAPALHARLQQLDPDAASRIEPQDPVRVVRALEIHEVTGGRASERRVSHAGPERVQARWVLLEADTGFLRPRLKARAAAMLAAGLVDEARALRRRLGPEHRLLSTMGYQEALLVVDGALDEPAAVDAIERRWWQYARRQRTWFRKEPWWHRLDAALGTDALFTALKGM
jgi:tRNA dimethylallyltransferase